MEICHAQEEQWRGHSGQTRAATATGCSRCAADAFADRGIDASLEGIAKAAGVGIGTLYRHYPTRDALVEAVYRHNVELLCDGADELRATLPPDEALAEWMQRFVAYVASKKGLANYLKSVVSRGLRPLQSTTRARVLGDDRRAGRRRLPQPARSAPASKAWTCCARSAASA